MPTKCDNCCYYGCHALLLTISYFLIILIVSTLNTVTWITENPLRLLYHSEALYAVRKGFNVFFVVTVLVVIVIVCYRIGDHVLRIPNIKTRAHYNFVLLIASLLAVIAIPIGFMAVAVYLYEVGYRPTLSTNFYLQVMVNFCAINAIILFVFFDLLLLTALLSTLRTYNIFKHLIKIRTGKRSASKPLLPTKLEIPFKKPPRYPPFYSRLRQPGLGPGPGRRNIRRGVHPMQTVPESSALGSLRTASIRSIGAARRMNLRFQPSSMSGSSIYSSSYSPLPTAGSIQSQLPFQFANRQQHPSSRRLPLAQPSLHHQLDYPYDYQQDQLLDNDPAGSMEQLRTPPSSPTMSSAYHYFPSSTRTSSIISSSDSSDAKKLTPSIVHHHVV